MCFHAAGSGSDGHNHKPVVSRTNISQFDDTLYRVILLGHLNENIS